ncbi:hypothetical protein [Prevotella sp. 10(H)]|uniref:hypothetical protein n=1 Tax=Prevotella sp. 10(H) TaxID=1158294 RepID=UPI0004A6C0B0|nr:hypothetical protein [Prevotella sp. 10(H)]
MSLLNLGKQSVYRRLRNEIPFTFEEITILSSQIGFSIDEIVGRLNQNNEVAALMKDSKLASLDQYLGSRYKVNQLLERIRKDENSKIIAATNRLPYIYTAAYENLTKMEYYKWYHQQQEYFTELTFKKFKMPSSIISESKKIIYNGTLINKYTLLLDQNILKPILKEINYYYERDMIDDDELCVLQEELLQVVNELESLATKGHYKSGSEVNIYLSSLNIGSNCIHLENDNNACFVIWMNSTEPVTIFNNNICSAQKRLMLSLKKYSTLITQCNEFSRSIFFKRQRESIMKMKDERSVYL